MSTVMTEVLCIVMQGVYSYAMWWRKWCNLMHKVIHRILQYMMKGLDLWTDVMPCDANSDANQFHNTNNATSHAMWCNTCCHLMQIVMDDSFKHVVKLLWMLMKQIMHCDANTDAQICSWFEILNKWWIVRHTQHRSEHIYISYWLVQCRESC